MIKIIIAAAAATFSLSAVGAHAAVLQSAVGGKLGFGGTSGTFDVSPPSGNSFVITYDTGDSRGIAGRAEFVVDGGSFNLSIGDLAFSMADGSGIYALQDVTNGGFITGEVGDNLGGCSNRYPTLSVNVACRRLGSGQGSDPATSGDVLFSNLSAGTYAFLFYEGDNRSPSGTFQLVVTSVPTPAAGVVFGSALLGAAYIRRRRGLSV
ncbi:MAG: hypothetical protein AAF607_17195 [Pseudomonadota bacterium]